jgi:hypothetical protein
VSDGMEDDGPGDWGDVDIEATIADAVEADPDFGALVRAADAWRDERATESASDFCARVLRLKARLAKPAGRFARRTLHGKKPSGGERR